MSKKDSTGASGGLMSSAGLTTYYDAEDQNLAVDPRTVSLVVILTGVIVLGLNVII